LVKKAKLRKPWNGEKLKVNPPKKKSEFPKVGKNNWRPQERAGKNQE